MERYVHNLVRQNGGYFRYPLIFVTAVIIASSELFGEISPLALAFIGSLSSGDTLFAFLGTLSAFTIVGNFFEAVPILSMMLVVGVFRFFFAVNANNYINRRSATSGNSTRLINISSALLTGISAGIVGAISATGVSDLIGTVVIALATGLLSYCLTITYRLFVSGHIQIFTKLNSSHLSFEGGIAPCGSILLAVAVLSNLSYIHQMSVNFGTVLGTIIALTFSKSKASGKSLVSILVAAGMVIVSSNFAPAMIVFALAATVSGLFSKSSSAKITQSAAFIFALGVGISIIGINPYTLTTMLGASVGSMLYILLPLEAFMTFTSRFENHTSIPNAVPTTTQNAAINIKTVPAEIFSERLRLASGALNDVKTAVEKAGEVLDKRGIKDFSWVYNSAGDLICRKCKHNMVCWGEEYNDTVTKMNKLSSKLRCGEQLNEKDLPPKIASRCERKPEFFYALSERYREFVTINSTNRKIAEMRTILTAQLSATENLMQTMSDEFLDYSHYDHKMALCVEKILRENGISNPKVAVIITNERISIEGYGKGVLDCDDSRLGDLVSESLQRQFDLPETISTPSNDTHNSHHFRFTMYERALYSVEYGAYQLSKIGKNACGDYYDSFVDGKGYAYIVLSDGMGSGSRARVDSAFACGMLIKLLRAGIGLESALEIINNSLLVKSSDESFATLDICRIDLYTGKTELFKAGAAASYVHCNKKLIKAEGKGLPVGIGYKAVYESRSFTIGNCDMVIMASDGAELNEKWLEHELNRSSDIEDLNETAKTLVDTAKFSSERHDSRAREDDISVIAVKLVK
ncbi:MAG: SpoIIE family protein phosphatase [Oscillospiraceae bacterium]|nr:SpoIIE family protein phosphatase [Oscillospiraceae bacterium]